MIIQKTDLARNREEEDYVRRAQQKYLMDNTPASLLANALLALLLFLILKDAVPLKQVIISTGSIWTVIVFRAVLFFIFHKNGPLFTDSRKWKATYMAGLIFTAAAWSTPIWIAYPVDFPISQIYLLLLLAGMTSGAVLSLSSNYGIMLFYTQGLLLPLFLRNLFFFQPHSASLLILVVLYDLFICLTSWNLHKRIIKNIDLEYNHRTALKKLNLSEQRFSQIFHEAPSGIFYYNRNLVLEEANDRLAEILKTPLEELKGLNMNQIQDKRIIPAIKKAFQGKAGYYEGEYHTSLSDQTIDVTLQTSPIEDSKGNITGGVAIVQDITEKTRIQKEIHHQAYHDILTGLPNRQLLMDRLSQALKSAKRHTHQGVLMYLDLDKFKLINDSMGHQVGDQLLREVASRLSVTLRQEDTVARMGGDEFVVLLPEVSMDKEASVIYSGIVAEKIHQALSDPFQLNDHKVNTSTSIGVNVFTGDEASPDEILKHADTAMYHAKEQGRSRTSFFQAEMDAILQDQMSLENDLTLALKEESLDIYIQPIVSIDRKRVCGAEALLRWFHPEKGYINPEKIIHAAEKTGQIIPLGKWIMKRSLQIYRDLITKDSFELDYISINISIRQILQQDFVAETLKLIRESGIAMDRIVLEITESILITDFDNTVQKMRELRSRGVQFALDDFGTGYSSLSYLKKLPLDKLKIDRSFTENILTDSNDYALVETIMSIADHFDLQVITEGVEEMEQVEALESMNCPFYQGYYCSKPLKPGEFAGFSKEFNRKAY